MMNQFIRMVRMVAVVPLAGLSLFIYKVALQPAIHQFYKLEPDMLMVYGLVLVAALAHAVLLSSVVLKFYHTSLGVVCGVMSLAVLAYCIQMAWLSPLEHTVFWLVTFFAYGVIWAGVLWFGQRLMQREQTFEMHAHITNNTDSFGLSAKNRPS
ncbi:hypothetical protein [Alkanindiges illinoisensis]|uniref:hypothetical protein n=1 Tax=Alkanindiges illinoisensis TaxID=197183 RepID=UPI00047A2EC9|nr:hypothetical protein [Alkanindiges illinoisensis]